MAGRAVSQDEREETDRRFMAAALRLSKNTPD